MGFMKNPHPVPIVGGLTTLRHKVTLLLGDPPASSTGPDPQTRMYTAGKGKISFLISFDKTQELGVHRFPGLSLLCSDHHLHFRVRCNI